MGNSGLFDPQAIRLDPFPPLRPDPPRPCAVCQAPHSRPQSVFCSTTCRAIFTQRARERHALDDAALAVFNEIIVG